MQHPDFWKPISDKSRPEYAQLLHQIDHAVVVSLQRASLFSGFKLPAGRRWENLARCHQSIISTIVSNIFSIRVTPLNIHPSPASRTTSSNASLLFTRFFTGVLPSNHITRRKSLHSYFITFEGACYMIVAGKRKSLKTTCYGVSDSIKSSLYTNNSFPLR